MSGIGPYTDKVRKELRDRYGLADDNPYAGKIASACIQGYQRDLGAQTCAAGIAQDLGLAEPKDPRQRDMFS